MCVSKKEVRTGVNGLLDCVDVLNSVQSKVVPILNLILQLPNSSGGKGNLSDNELGSVLSVVRDILEEAWTANEGLEAIYKELAKSKRKENKL